MSSSNGDDTRSETTEPGNRTSTPAAATESVPLSRRAALAGVAGAGLLGMTSGGAAASRVSQWGDPDPSRCPEGNLEHWRRGRNARENALYNLCGIELVDSDIVTKFDGSGLAVDDDGVLNFDGEDNNDRYLDWDDDVDMLNFTGAAEWSDQVNSDEVGNSFVPVTNSVSGSNSVVGGGANNEAAGNYATVAGGSHNLADNVGATVGGGGGQQQVEGNTASGQYATVAGGEGNTAAGDHSFVGGGGNGNTATSDGTHQVIGGGDENTASANYATIPGGNNNTASATHSFAAGAGATAEHNGAFVWSDSSDTNDDAVTSTASNEVRFQASGGFAVQDGNLTIEDNNGLQADNLDVHDRSDGIELLANAHGQTLTDTDGTLTLHGGGSGVNVGTGSEGVELRTSGIFDVNDSDVTNDGGGALVLDGAGDGVNIGSDSTSEVTTFASDGNVDLNSSTLTDDDGIINLGTTLDTGGNGIESDTSVSVDIDNDSNSSGETFAVTHDGGTALLTVNEGGSVDIESGSLDLNANDITNIATAHATTVNTDNLNADTGSEIVVGDSLDVGANDIHSAGSVTVAFDEDTSGGGTFTVQEGSTDRLVINQGGDTDVLGGNLDLNGNDIDSVGGSTPATSGAIRLANNVAMTARDSNNSNDITLIEATSGDDISLGASGGTPDVDIVDANGNQIWDASAAEVPRGSQTNDVSQTDIKTSNYTTSGDGSDESIPVDSSGGEVTITLAAGDAVAGRRIRIFDNSGSANPIHISTASGVITSPSSTTITANFGYREYESNGTHWKEVSAN